MAYNPESPNYQINGFRGVNSLYRPPSGGSSSAARSLGGILDEQFAPEYERLNEGLPGIEELFNERVASGPDYSAYSGALEDFAGSVFEQYFGSGGAVEGASRAALGQAVQSGFGPTSGGFDNARMNILREASGQFGQAVAGQATQLAGYASQDRGIDIQSLLGYTGLQAGRRDALAESLFGGQATIDQQGIDREVLDLNRRMIEQALRNSGQSIGSRLGGGLSGAASGAIAGSIIPGIGTGIGAAIGGIAGLFG